MQPTTTALITGASTGIGYELAKLFAADQHNLILVARNKELLDKSARELQQQFSVTITTVAIDLSLPNAAEQLMQQIGDQPIDFLVNNAGFGIYGDFSSSDLIMDKQLIAVNIAALTELTQLCLSKMMQQNRGKILQIASTSAFQPGPYMALYFASKAFVLSFSQAIAYELRNTHITVTCLCPGPTKTEFQKRAKLEYTPIFQRGVMSAGKVALIGYQAMQKGKRVVIPGIRNKLLAFSTRLVPLRLATNVTGKLVSTRRKL